jgi:hypothetical protein
LLAPFNGQAAVAWRREGDPYKLEQAKLMVRVGNAVSEWPIDYTTPGEAPAIAALDNSMLVLVYTNASDQAGTYAQQYGLIDATGAKLTWGNLGADRFEPTLTTTPVGVVLSWREPSKMLNGAWDDKYEDLYMQRLQWGGMQWIEHPILPVPQDSPFRKGDQRNTAIAHMPITTNGAAVVVWDDWADPKMHADIKISIEMLPFVREVQ